MRDQRFTFLCTREERVLLTQLSRRLERSEADTVRVALREKARRELPDPPRPAPSPPSEPAHV